MLTVTKRFSFSAAHRLAIPGTSEEDNTFLFGKCASPNWHGHNYTLEVTVSGTLDTHSGMIIDLNKLKELVQIHIVNELDHKNLNLDVEWLQGKTSTLENLVVAIYNRINKRLSMQNIQLISVKLQETDSNWCTYTGE